MMRFPARLLALGLGVLLVTALAVIWLISGDGEKRLVADFPRTTNLYPGAPVKVLGVPIGSVRSVVVEGTRVRVEMSYAGNLRLPAHVHAVIVPPSIVGDRFVQLTPPYTGGPVLADGARLDEKRTEVPVELDEAYQTVNELAQALGPRGSNAEGALSRLLTESAANLSGNGDAVRQMISEFSGAVDTLAGSREDIAGTVTNLGSVTANLAASDEEVRDLIGNLATVSGELNGQRDELRDAVENLNGAMTDIARFVRDNREAVHGAVGGLARVTTTVAEHQRDLAEVLDTAPLGVSNLYDLVLPVNYDQTRPGDVVPEARTSVVAARPGGEVPNLPVQLGYALTAMCAQLPAAQQQQLAPTCTALQRAGGDFGEVLLDLANPVLGPGLGSRSGSGDLAGLLLGGHR